MFSSCVFWIQTKSPFYYLGRSNILSGLVIFNIWAEQEGACNNFRVPAVSGNVNHFHFQTWVFLLNRFRSVNNMILFTSLPAGTVKPYTLKLFFSPFQLYFLYHLSCWTSWICYSQCFINGVDFRYWCYCKKRKRGFIWSFLLRWISTLYVRNLVNMKLNILVHVFSTVKYCVQSKIKGKLGGSGN